MLIRALTLRPLFEGEKEGKTGETTEEKKVEEKTEEVEEKIEEKVDAKTEETEEEKEDWRDKEIRRKHRQISDKDRELQQTRQELADAKALLERGNEGADKTEKKTLTQDDVKAEARRLRAQETYDEQCNSANAKGKEVYKDKWNKAIDRITELGGLTMDDMSSILATDDPSKVLFELGSNPEEYQRIMGLPEARRRNEMTKIAIKEAKTGKTISKAPEPVEEVRSTSKTSKEPTDSDDDDTWYAKRAAQRKARRAANA